MISTEALMNALIGSVISSGVLIVLGKAIIREAIKEDLKEVKHRIDEMEKEVKHRIDEMEKETNRRMTQIEKDYVPCTLCDAQTAHTTNLFSSIDSKLEILIEHSVNNKPY